MLKVTHGLPLADLAREQTHIASLRLLANDAHLDPDLAEKLSNFIIRGTSSFAVIGDHEMLAAEHNSQSDQITFADGWTA